MRIRKNLDFILFFIKYFMNFNFKQKFSESKKEILRNSKDFEI